MKWFTADPHFGQDSHNGGIVTMMGRVRPDGQVFGSFQEHDAFLMDTINSCVDRADELYILGDFAWAKPGKYRAQMKCKHARLILGNHDKRGKCSQVFGDIRDTMVTKLTGGYDEKAFLSHYPHAFWNGSHRGWIHLYGHCHGMREKTLDRHYPERRSMDVGVDNIYKLLGEYRPISEVEILNYMAHRIGHDPVSWYNSWRHEEFYQRGI